MTEPIAHNPANFSVDLFSPAAASEYRGQVVVLLLVVVLLVVSAGPSVVEYNNGMWKAKSVTWTLAPGGMMNGSANASGAAWTKQFAPPSGTTEINATVSVKGTYTFVDSNSQSMMMEIDGTSDSSPIAWSSSNLTVSWVISLDDSGLSVV